jgi:hypothetical protein
MTAKDRVLERERQRGYEAAKAVQAKADDMSGTELYAVDDRIPAFLAAREKVNMLKRDIGFVCKSSAGRVVRLIQPYDSEIYTDEPETLPAQWAFKWSTDPKKALPFVAISTSPFNTGDCCTYEDRVWRSGQDANTWEPGTANVKWEDLGTIEEVIG